MRLNFVRNLLDEAGEFYYFSSQFFKEGFKPRYEFSELKRQCYFIGNKTLPLVGINGFIMGLVITFQSHPSMKAFGEESWLPSVVSVSLVREIVPIITALICAGKIVSGIVAELGSMKVTEQIDAMEVSGTNPYILTIIWKFLSIPDPLKNILKEWVK